MHDLARKLVVYIMPTRRDEALSVGLWCEDQVSEDEIGTWGLRVIERSQEIQWGLTTLPFSVRRTEREKTVLPGHRGAGSFVVHRSGRGQHHSPQAGSSVRRKAWVATRLRKVRDLPPPPSEREFVAGESVRYMGSQYRLTSRRRTIRPTLGIWRGRYGLESPKGSTGKLAVSKFGVVSSPR